ncbi:PREDICTED: non-specific lipid-transfer protein-like protein At2g13820 isoform X2 [Tarenaya hassleriana]|uniref:non-specific lipid-transfer protein-like protein At2g13820 isoform X2 n=1 Tax=Tarenaya hassleriana TaxID=28532 RepID=UPI0008FD118E|nr:PREDICTED: non-specific lipid-transfer protein-like protein At2g13820 isoform X2 [Tarenaya hassleriana]
MGRPPTDSELQNYVTLHNMENLMCCRKKHIVHADFSVNGFYIFFIFIKLHYHTKPVESHHKLESLRKTLICIPNIGFFPKKLKPTSENTTMASTLFLSVLIFFAPMVLSQNPSTAAPPCASRLLALAPCGPFVQGLTQLPAQPCCDSLGQIYVQEPTCLCLFLNNTYAFPIDKTLALQLPRLCDIPANASTCSGVSAAQDSPVAPPLNSAVSPISLGAKNNSPVAGNPVYQISASIN